MIRMNNDYSRGCIPAILHVLESSNSEDFAGYGDDGLCHAAIDLLREEIGWEDADIHFFPGATQANLTIHAAALRPTESVIAAETGHIVGHECASIEATGHKILTAAPASTDGKLTAADVEKIVSAYQEAGAAEYLTEPRMVYISQPTEYGGLYTLEELQLLKDVCEDNDLYLYVDGARLAYALGAEGNDVTLWDLAALCDAFTIGGTKCGALFGEAMVITNDALKRRFKAQMKQQGAVLAKGWLMGIQFYTLFKNGDYARLGAEADKQALRIREGARAAGVDLYTESATNQQFLLLNKEQCHALGRTFVYEDFGASADGRRIVRLCTSWSTDPLEVDALVSALSYLS
ncbi:MAG: beta-eliminating lyase-related protein [Peptococcaceae bacterium]|nr:beta-eliminating lyase-related protein [Peptococcaceae bacterium]